MSQRDLFSDPAPTSPATSHVNPLALPLVDRCEKCGGTEHVDRRLWHWPHAGRSVRRDCARCGWTFGFSRWYDTEVEVAE